MRFIGWLLLGLSTALIAYKLFFLDYSWELMLPEKSYNVRYQLMGESDARAISLSAFVPTEDSRQHIYNESFSSSQFRFKIEGEDFQKKATWASDNITGPFAVSYSFSVLAKSVEWKIDPDLNVSDLKNNEMEIFLGPSEMIQTGHASIQKLHRDIVGTEKNITEVLKSIFNYAAGIPTLPFKGSTSALTALVLNKASCNGKSRLMVALMRISGIPSRVVGGLIMDGSEKRTSHQWVEAFIAGHWISFDPINNHFARIPYNFLKVYESDEVMFSHTADVSFDWLFSTSQVLVPSTKLHRLSESSFNALDLFDWLAKTGVSLGIIKILLVLPIGALVATFFRNVIGLQTFGTFLPALIAAAAQSTGVWWGLFGFTLVIMILFWVRLAFEQFNLMHTPKLSAMLSVVVILLIGLSILSVHIPAIDLSHVTLFPIAILTLTTERFSLVVEEEGVRQAIITMLETLFVTYVCFFFMNSLFLQTSFLAFPELIIFVIALNIWLGRWVGLRVTEFWRFRKIILAGKQDDI